MKALDLEKMEQIEGGGDLQDCYHRGRTVGWLGLIGAATILKGGAALWAAAGVIVGSSGHCFE